MVTGITLSLRDGGLVPAMPNPHLVVPPRPGERARVRDEPLTCLAGSAPAWAVMSAHGGAGASTLTRWWPQAADSDGAWPANPDTTQLVVIAARACMPGLTAAASRLREWHAQLAPTGVLVAGLVLTAVRPGRLPRSVRLFRDIVAPLVGGAVYFVDWHDELVALELRDLAPCNITSAGASRRRRSALTEAAPGEVADIAARITQSINELRGTGVLPRA